MAIVRRQAAVQAPKQPKTATAPARGKRSPAEVLKGFELPAERSKPSERLSDYSWLIYGPKGIGKTTLAAQMELEADRKVLFILFEPGAKALSLYKTPVITDWAQMRYVVEQLEKDPQGYGTVVLDPGPIAYKRCLEYVSRSLGIQHPGAVSDYGASWDKVSTEFQLVHSRLASLGLGFVILAHDKMNEVQRRDGSKWVKTQPYMSGSTEEFYAGIIDVLAYYHYVGGERFLMIRGDEHTDAKCRLDEHFRTPEGKPVIRIPMGDSPAEAWKMVLDAYNNKQMNTYSDAELYHKK